MLIDKLPLYALRAYNRIYSEDGFTLVDTAYTTWVLDCPSLPGDYAQRRLRLRAMELPYSMYNLRERYSTLSQLVKSKRTKFINCDGKIVRYRKTTYTRVEYTKVLQNDTTWNGKNRVTTKLNTCFITDEPAQYIGYLKFGHALFLFETCDELKPSRKIKI